MRRDADMARIWNGWTRDDDKPGRWYTQCGTARVVMTCLPDAQPLEPAGVFTIEWGEVVPQAPLGQLASPEFDAVVQRLYARAREGVDNLWNHPKDMIGAVLYRAMIGAELLRMCAWQDEEVSAVTVRMLAEALWQRLRDDDDVNES